MNDESLEVVVAGVGMHRFGRFGVDSSQLAVHAARAALRDAGVPSSDVRAVEASCTLRSGLSGCLAGTTLAARLGLHGVEVGNSYAACASGALALAAAGSRIRARECDVALVVGSDVSPGGLLRPALASGPADPERVRHDLGLSNPVYLGLRARRRMHVHGTTVRDYSALRVKNARHGATNLNARYRQRLTLEQVESSPVLCDPLRLLHVCAVSDGAAAAVLVSRAYARRRGLPGPVLAAVTASSPPFPSDGLDLGCLATDCTRRGPGRSPQRALASAAYERSGLGPEDLSLAEVYDLSPETELAAYEALGLCPAGGAERLLRDGDTSLGGRVPVNPSGGLSSFGEAPSAQVLAQLCELVWQLRGSCGARQVPRARAAIAMSHGIHGTGGAVVVTR